MMTDDMLSWIKYLQIKPTFHKRLVSFGTIGLITVILLGTAHKKKFG